MKKILKISVLFWVILNTANAQLLVTPQVLNVAGGTAKIGYYQYDYSIGELCLTETFATPNIVVTNGVLQPCSNEKPASPPVFFFTTNEYKLFPNPTAGKFELNLLLAIKGNMTLQLLNTTGQVLEKRNFHYECCGRIERFDISKYASGVYFIDMKLTPDVGRSGDGLISIRHSSVKVIKM